MWFRDAVLATLARMLRRARAADVGWPGRSGAGRPGRRSRALMVGVFVLGTVARRVRRSGRPIWVRWPGRGRCMRGIRGCSSRRCSTGWRIRGIRRRRRTWRSRVRRLRVWPRRTAVGRLRLVPGRVELRAGAHPRADPAAALGGGAGDQAAGAGGGGVGRRRRVAGSPTAAGMTGRWRCGRATDAPGRGGGVRSHGRGGGRPPTACSCWARAASARTPRGPCSSRAIPTRSGSRRPASHCTATAPSSTSARLRLWLARGQRAALHSSSGTNGSTSRFAQARLCFRARSARPVPNRPATTNVCGVVRTRPPAERERNPQA